jgi:hypothetical protein
VYALDASNGDLLRVLHLKGDFIYDLAVVNGQKYLSYDVAAWADLWFYSNPIYIEVAGSTPIAGVP